MLIGFLISLFAVIISLKNKNLKKYTVVVTPLVIVLLVVGALYLFNA
jgi:Flp pilus assembly protein protease CpaA